MRKSVLLSTRSLRYLHFPMRVHPDRLDNGIGVCCPRCRCLRYFVDLNTSRDLCCTRRSWALWKGTLPPVLPRETSSTAMRLRLYRNTTTPGNFFRGKMLKFEEKKKRIKLWFTTWQRYKYIVCIMTLERIWAFFSKHGIIEFLWNIISRNYS